MMQPRFILWGMSVIRAKILSSAPRPRAVKLRREKRFCLRENLIAISRKARATRE